MIKQVLRVACLICCTQVLASEDPFLWLEEVDGEKANAWVAGQNEATFTEFTESESFDKLKNELHTLYDASDRIPTATVKDGYRYNFWRDEKNPRGLLRRTTESSYRSQNPNWETVLDVDALAAADDENWVYKGHHSTSGSDRILVRLSRGGADAVVIREFDLRTKAFVKDGFFVPEAKTRLAWYDNDTLLIGTETGPNSLTDSGYPRQIRKWVRGKPLAAAPIVFEGSKKDISVSVATDLEENYEFALIVHSRTFYEADYYLEWEGDWHKLNLPDQVDVDLHRGQLFVSPKQDWQIDDLTVKSGSLAVVNIDDFMQGKSKFELIYEPKEGKSLAQFAPIKDHVIVNELANVTNHLYLASREKTWTLTPIKGQPKLSRQSVRVLDAHQSNDYEVSITSFLKPQTLNGQTIKGEPLYTKALNPKFSDRGLTVEQHWAISKDGTKVPYFQVGPRDPKNLTTILYGYGGFEISMAPFYSVTVGHAWLQRGNVYVVANIRGGGEFGPQWHQAALRENRLRAYEDFIAVAEDLIARGVTSSKKLGTTGGSNGGLLAGNMLTMRPDLFGAVVSQVPLLDMRRYNKLLAGASWVAEYGDPDNPDDWAFMEAFSPYHNVDAKKQYPPTLFTTSKRDDRVHPGHARKMMALMASQGKDVYFYENVEGGHAGAANNAQTAFNSALIYEFFRNKLD